MAYTDDKYKFQPRNRDGTEIGHEIRQPEDDNDHFAEQQSYTTPASFRNGRWEHLYRSSSYNSGALEYQTSFENTNCTRADSAGPDFTSQMGYGKREVAMMPSLPEIDMARNFYSPPALTDSFQSIGTNEYQGVSATGSSESTSSLKSYDRPAPAKSAFMLFSEAKRVEIMRRATSSGKVREFNHLFSKMLLTLSYNTHRSTV